MKFVYFFIILNLSFSAYAEETISLKGKLFERGTKNPLSDVNIFILPYKIKVTTMRNGEFFIPSIPKGNCELIINHVNYNKFARLNMCDITNESLQLYLEKTFTTTFETTVKSKYIKRDDQSHSLSQEEFIHMPGSFGGDPVRAAQNLPGIARSGSSAQIIIQGAAPEDTGYLINGHPVPLIFHFGGLSSVIIPEAVSHVELFPSGYGPEYSKAIGGIIGLTTKSPNDERWKGMAFMDLLNSGGIIEGPIDDKSNISVAGRYCYIGQVLKAVANKNDNVQLTAAPNYYDFTTIYERKLNSNNKFQITFLGSRDELSLVLNKTKDPALKGNFYNRTGFFRVIPQLTTDLGNNSSMTHSLGIGKDYVLIDIGSQYLDITSSVITHRSEYTKEFSSTYKFYLGLDNQFTWSTVNVNLPSIYSIGGVPNPFSTGDQKKYGISHFESVLGAYIRQEYKFAANSPWTLLPNFRLDHFTATKETYLEPRFQARYQFSDSLLLRGSIGQYYQPPKPQEYDKFYGNALIKSPEAIHYTVGWTKDFRKTGESEGLEFTNNYFYKDLKNLVIPDIRTNYSNSGTGTITGGEVQAKYKWNEWSSQIVYTYLNSKRTIPGFGTRPSQYNQTHNLNLIGSLSKENWTYGGRFRIVSGNPYTPITGGVFDTNNDVYIPTRGEIYSKRFGAFTQLDFRVDRKLINDTWILTAYLDIQNLLNAKNTSSIQYSYDYAQSEQVNGLPILPTVGIKGEF